MLIAQLSDALAGAFAKAEDVPEIARQIAAVVDNFLTKEGGEGEEDEDGAFE